MTAALRRLSAAASVVAALVVAAPAHAAPPAPPGPPRSGPGSEERAITSERDATVVEAGDWADGTKVVWWVPAVLRDGPRAPVVVLLHGFGAVFPGLYRQTIDHLVRQGAVVVFPVFQRGLADTDQNVMLARAQAAVRLVLHRLGRTAQRRDVVVAGHSLGGLLAAAWNPAGGPRARALVLDHPSLAGTPFADPGTFQPPVAVTPIDIGTLAPRVRVPVTILTGDRDRIAPPAEATTLAGLLRRAPACVWEARRDDHGAPPMRSGHLVPLAGAFTTDAMDWRFGWAALDVALAGGGCPAAFDLGRWSDGVPVRPPQRLVPAG